MSTERRPIVLVLAVLSGCGGGEARHESAARGERPVSTAAERVISLIPSVTETIVALGAGDRLVARSEYDRDPSLNHLPSIGHGLTPSLERLTMLRPDLVIAWPDSPNRSVIGRLAELGVTIYSPEIQTLEDIRRTTNELGVILDRETSADSLLRAIDEGLSEVRRAVAGRSTPSVLYVVWHEPITTAGAGTYIDELIEIAGGANLFRDAPGLWPQLSLEEIVRRQPDHVILAQTEDNPIEPTALGEQVGWRELKAVQEGRFVAVDADLYNRPGPRVVLAVRQLAHLLQPAAVPAPRR